MMDKTKTITDKIGITLNLGLLLIDWWIILNPSTVLPQTALKRIPKIILELGKLYGKLYSLEIESIIFGLVVLFIKVIYKKTYNDALVSYIINWYVYNYIDNIGVYGFNLFFLTGNFTSVSTKNIKDSSGILFMLLYSTIIESIFSCSQIKNSYLKYEEEYYKSF